MASRECDQRGSIMNKYLKQYLVTIITMFVVCDEILIHFVSWRVMLFPFAFVLSMSALWIEGSREKELKAGGCLLPAVWLCYPVHG